MHCILEGLVAHHTQNLLRLTNEDTSQTSKSAPAFEYTFKTPDPTDAAALLMTTKEMLQVPAIHNLLVTQVSHPPNSARSDTFMEKLQKKLSQKNICTLQYVCQTLGCTPTNSSRVLKTDYVTALVDWVSGPAALMIKC